MSTARNYDGGRASVLSVLTDEFQSIGRIKTASKTTHKRAAKLLAELKAEGLVRMKWSRIGTKLYALPGQPEANHGGMTLEQVGAALGITKERVRQIEFSALRKLQHNARVLREFLCD